MPKKSNKTAHVLSLLTSGGSEGSGENENIVITNYNHISPVNESVPATPSEVVVEVEGTNGSDFLSDLVRADLERELDKDRLSSKKANPISETTFDSQRKPLSSSKKNTTDDDISPAERPPYSPTFMAKFGIDSTSTESPVEVSDENAGKMVTQEDLPVSLDQVKSEAYVLEDFNDEEESVSMDENTANIKILHNIVEDVIKLRVPEVMKSLNMCYCTDCAYDVMALTLNHMQPLYTVTEKGLLYQKLNAYETQYGTDLTTEITKACLKVKLHPNHHNNSEK